MTKNPLILKLDPHAWHLLRWLSFYPFVLFAALSYGAVFLALLEGKPVDLGDTSNIRIPIYVALGGFLIWLARIGRDFGKLAIMLGIAYVVASYMKWSEKRRLASRYAKISRSR